MGWIAILKALTQRKINVAHAKYKIAAFRTQNSSGLHQEENVCVQHRTVR